MYESLEEPLFSLNQRITHDYSGYGLGDRVKQFMGILSKSLGTFKGNVTVKDLRNKSYEDLEDLILAFEIYLTEYVEKIPIEKKDLIDAIKVIKPDHVLSFNYTKTYEKHYAGKDDVKVCYIHGFCDENRNPKDNNLVLGIDEYLDQEEIGQNTDFAIFRKYIQRIRKKTDTSYAEWAREINDIYEHNKITWGLVQEPKYLGGVTEVWVYGHSLDVTDKDILRRFLGTDATAIHIFAYDKAAEGELIAKLLSIVDYDTVVEKSTAMPPKLDFLCINEK